VDHGIPRWQRVDGVLAPQARDVSQRLGVWRKPFMDSRRISKRNRAASESPLVVGICLAERGVSDRRQQGSHEKLLAQSAGRALNGQKFIIPL
jgi:hypothetical protein